MVMPTNMERLARMEVEVSELKEAFREHKTDTAVKFTEVNHKLDELLALRNKGAGVLWLIGGVVSTGLVSLVFQLLHWFGAK